MNRKRISKLIVGLLAISMLLSGCSNNIASSKASTQSTQTESTQSKDDSQIETYFTRKDGNLDQILIKQMNTAQKNLNVAIYSFTKGNIADAILEAKKRGVDVKVITDKQESQSKYQKAILDKLKANNIPVRINSHAGLMHLKVTIIDDKIVTGGSYNYTESATKNNDENLILMKDPQLVNQYNTEYTSMWNNNDDYMNY